MNKKRGKTTKKIKFLNKFLSVVIFIVILNLAFFTVYALLFTNIRHDYNQILVTINGYNVTLQEAIDNHYLEGVNQPSSSTLSGVPNPGHRASEVLVTISTDIVTLQEAVDNNFFNNPIPVDFVSNPPNIRHPASRIEVIVDSTQIILQDAVDEGKFYYQWFENSWSDCTNPCEGIQTRIVDCIRGDELLIEDNYCVKIRGDKPLTDRVCDSTCGWFIGSWSDCNNPCGGIQTRTVYCALGNGSLIEDSYCLQFVGAKPPTDQVCGSICEWYSLGDARRWYFAGGGPPSTCSLLPETMQCYNLGESICFYWPVSWNYGIVASFECKFQETTGKWTLTDMGCIPSDCAYVACDQSCDIQEGDACSPIGDTYGTCCGNCWCAGGPSCCPYLFECL